MSYRDDQEHLETRRDELKSELAEVEHKAEALRSAVAQKGDIERELAQVEARLARGKRRSPLDDIRIASPCHERWDDMSGDDRARFCASCAKTVYDLSTMTRDEAERLLSEREGSLCVRLWQRDDGTVLTADCPVGGRRKRVRLAIYGALGGGALTAMAVMAVATPQMGAPAMPMESFVEMEPGQVAGGVVLQYTNDLLSAKGTVRLTVYANGHAVLGHGGSVTTAQLDQAKMASIRARADAIGSHTFGVVDDRADSAVHETMVVRGAGGAPDRGEDKQELLREARALVRRLNVAGAD